jgi:hypothetical protein
LGQGRPATKKVKLTLTAEHVRRSMKLHGVGNTQTCSMAVCAKEQAEQFPHPVHGYIDWQYSRAYVVTKVSKAHGMPTACVVYTHTDDIAKLNDSKNGTGKAPEAVGSQWRARGTPSAHSASLHRSMLGRRAEDWRAHLATQQPTERGCVSQ